jgi:hypothetical protein
MPILDNLTFAYSDPGTGANTAQYFHGGPAVIIFVFTAAASTTTIKGEISVDNGSTWCDLEDVNSAVVTKSSASAFDSMFQLRLPPCLIRTNITAAGGATTTGDVWVTSAINEYDAS